jgi:hypothetical protein
MAWRCSITLWLMPACCQQGSGPGREGRVGWAEEGGLLGGCGVPSCATSTPAESTAVSIAQRKTFFGIVVSVGTTFEARNPESKFNPPSQQRLENGRAEGAGVACPFSLPRQSGCARRHGPEGRTGTMRWADTGTQIARHSPSPWAREMLQSKIVPPGNVSVGRVAQLAEQLTLNQ